MRRHCACKELHPARVTNGTHVVVHRTLRERRRGQEEKRRRRQNASGDEMEREERPRMRVVADLVHAELKLLEVFAALIKVAPQNKFLMETEKA